MTHPLTRSSPRPPRRWLRWLALALPAVLAVGTAAELVAAPVASPAQAATRSAVTWPSGVFLGTGANTAAVNRFASWRGAKVSYAEIYAPRDSWTHMADDQWLVKQYAKFPGKLSIALPLTMGRTDLAAVARGAADGYYRTFAQHLAALGRGNSDLRLGWEFNGNWYGWSARNIATYLAAFRRVAKILHTVLPHATIDWNGNWGRSQCKHDPFTQLYPGNAYVDVVSLDAYDGGWVAANTPAKFAGWQKYSHGLQSWYDFAVAHGKKFAMAEWGLVRNGEKDNPEFIQGMFDFFAAHAAHIAYEAYFDSTGSALWNPNEYPRSSARYRSLWSRSVANTGGARTVNAPPTGSKAAAAMTASASADAYRVGHRLAVRGLPGSATGTVTFRTGSLRLCTARVSGGGATCWGGAGQHAGSHPIVASYGGDAHVRATTARTTLRVGRATPRMVATPRSRSLAKGQRQTLSARRLPGAPTSAVSFTVGRVHLCSAPLSGGSARCTTGPLGPGTYHVTARWNGGADFVPVTRTLSFTVRR